MTFKNATFSKYWQGLKSRFSVPFSLNDIPVLGEITAEFRRKDLISVVSFLYLFAYLAPGTASFNTQIPSQKTMFSPLSQPKKKKKKIHSKLTKFSIL